ncbi:MAG TPA: YbdK family carboxylate-amine ligase, partial [Ktedonobacteraceae bacterium]|nr:YbdK family carboxylate-amine ligase [Ktedonobacteraceae bacterium]
MSTHTPAWTIGVEEEYQIIDPTTRALSADAARLLSYIPSPSPLLASAEIQQSQIEMATPVCNTLAEVRTALQQARRTVIAAAEKAKRWIAAAGTHPFSHWQHQQVTAQPRYQEVYQMYQHLAREQVIFGCHVHLGCPDRERAIQVMNRLRPWLAPVLALATNSPFWLGEDTGYASFRTM